MIAEALERTSQIGIPSPSDRFPRSQPLRNETIMDYATFSYRSAALLAITLAAIVLAAVWVPRASAQTADEILDRVLAARGGVDKIKAIRTQRVSGTISFGPGAEGPFSVQFERPGKMHMEINIAGQAVVRVYDGKSAGWVINPFSPNKDVQPMSAEELRGISDESDFDGPLLDYQSKGNHIEFAGKDSIDGNQVVKIKLTNKNGEVRTYFFDASTYLLIKWEGQRHADNQDLNVETFFRDYRDVNGMKFAFEIDSDSPGVAQQQKITLDKIELNVPIDAALFGKPAAPPVAAEPAAPDAAASPQTPSPQTSQPPSDQTQPTSPPNPPPSGAPPQRKM
jgi:outer membrane lipoprotein-sorting protein